MFNKTKRGVIVTELDLKAVRTGVELGKMAAERVNGTAKQSVGAESKPKIAQGWSRWRLTTRNVGSFLREWDYRTANMTKWVILGNG